jgi:hypothetical protein
VGSDGVSEVRGDRAALWGELLRRVHEVSPGSAVHGDVSEGYAGEGDIDLFTPRHEWDLVEREFRAWAARHNLGPAIVCRHRAGVLVLVAAGVEGAPFFELEARAVRHFRGGTLFRADDLLPLTVDGPEGFRRIRPGAAGLLKLVPNGLRPGGRLAWKGPKAERVRALLAADPDGVDAAAGLFGPARRFVLAGARDMAGGGWDRRAMAIVEAWAAARSLRELPTLAARARVRLGRRAACPVLRAVNAGRRIPDDRARWFADVGNTHAVYGLEER